MARKKNRKNKSDNKVMASAPARATESLPVAKEIGQKEPVLKNGGTKKPVQPASGAVRVSTCIGGMFLTLVLGLYLGSLLPDMMAAWNEKNMAAAPAPQMPPPAKMEMPRPDLIPDTIPEAGSQKAVAETPTHISDKLAAHIAHMEKTATSQPPDARLWADLGNAYFDSRQTKKAIDAYQKSLALDPNNADVLTDLGIMYREEKAFDKAVESFRKASAIKPDHINALFNEGVVLAFDLNKKREAAEAWKKLLNFEPNARAPNNMKISEMIENLQ